MTFDQWWEKVATKGRKLDGEDKQLMRLAWDAALAYERKTVVCDACGYPTRDDGTCTRTQCCNSE